MQAIKVHAHIGHDGLLKLEVPVGVADKDVEAVVALSTASSAEQSVQTDENGYPVNFFEAIDSIQSDGHCSG